MQLEESNNNTDKNNNNAAADMRAQAARAIALLRRAAHVDRKHLGWATLWLIVAAGFEVAGPIFGKALIDQYL
ncbi:MAG: transporter ATP-binding protein, partial [Massilia sp.]|nr:transporter ATP-binding protein [Massilia sp.]